MNPTPSQGCAIQTTPPITLGRPASPWEIAEAVVSAVMPREGCHDPRCVVVDRLSGCVMPWGTGQLPLNLSVLFGVAELRAFVEMAEAAGCRHAPQGMRCMVAEHLKANPIEFPPTLVCWCGPSIRALALVPDTSEGEAWQRRASWQDAFNGKRGELEAIGGFWLPE